MFEKNLNKISTFNMRYLPLCDSFKYFAENIIKRVVTIGYALKEWTPSSNIFSTSNLFQSVHYYSKREAVLYASKWTI